MVNCYIKIYRINIMSVNIKKKIKGLDCFGNIMYYFKYNLFVIPN